MTTESHAAEDPQSREEVDIGNRQALARWAAALGTTADALESAVQAVGPRIDRIKDYLSGGMAGSQQDA